MDPALTHSVEIEIKQLEALEIGTLVETSELNYRVSSNIYPKLLCLYLRENDLLSAKFLWKRIPNETKLACPSLQIIWDLTVMLIKRNYSDFLRAALKCLPTLPASIQNHINIVYFDKLNTVADLIDSAYSCISVSDLSSSLLHISPHEAIQMMALRHWTLSEDGLFVCAPSESLDDSQKTGGGIPHAKLMSKLTEFMCFMENH